MRDGLERVVDRILDRSVVLSLDKRGFARHARHFAVDDLDVDLSGRVALVTGATSAIGTTTSEALARRGATVIMASRDRDRGAAAVEEVRALSGSSDVRLLTLDLTDLPREGELRHRLPGPRLDILLHGAGGDRKPPPKRVDLHRALAAYVVGPLRLTEQLLPLLRASRDARVVFVSSPQPEARRAQWIVTERLAHELRGTSISVHGMQTGWLDTPAVRIERPRFFSIARSILRTPEEGADTLIWLATAERLCRESGEYWMDRKRVAKPKVGGPFERERVWNEVCREAGVTWERTEVR